MSLYPWIFGGVLGLGDCHMAFGAFGMESEEPVVHCVDCQVTCVSFK